jgi:hypothetical protein
MLLMNDHPLSSSHPPDICLILRAHGEQRWLISEVIPTVRQLEQPDAIDEDQVGAALAYLEVLWLDACQRAAETDAARDQLDRDAPADQVLFQKARRYHTAVRRLRAVVARRVAALTGVPNEASVGWPGMHRYARS